MSTGTARPAVLVCGSFCLCAVLCFYLGTLISLVAGAVLFTLTHFVLLIRGARRKYQLLLLLCVAVFALMAFYAGTSLCRVSSQSGDADLSETADSAPFISFLITDTVYSGESGASYFAKAVSVNGAGLLSGFCARLDFYRSGGEELPNVGDTVSFAAKLEPITDTEDQAFSEKSYAKSFGASLCASVTYDSPVYIKEAGGLYALRLRVLGYLRDVLGKAAGDENSPLCAALLLGDKSGLSDLIKNTFSFCGISHLLAVSGFHVSLFLLTLSIPVTLIFRRPRLRSAVLIAAAFAYMFLCCFSASVTRAGLMASIAMLAAFFSRRPDGITVLFISASVILAFDPLSAGDTGLQLSFLATLGILISVHPFLRIMRSHPKLPASVKLAAASVFTTFSAVLFSLPVTVGAFGRVAFLTPLLTLIFTPLVQAVFFLSLVAVLLSPIPFASGIISLALKPVCAALSGLTRLCAAGNFGRFGAELPKLLIPIMLALIAAVTLIAALRGISGRIGRLVPLILLFSFALVCIPSAASASRYPSDLPEYVCVSTDGADVCAVLIGDKLAATAAGDSGNGLTLLRELASSRGFTRISSCILPMPSPHDTAAFLRLSGAVIVDTLFIPLPSGTAEKKICGELEAVAALYGTRVEHMPPVIMSSPHGFFASAAPDISARVKSFGCSCSVLYESHGQTLLYVSKDAPSGAFSGTPASVFAGCAGETGNAKGNITLDGLDLSALKLFAVSDSYALTGRELSRIKDAAVFTEISGDTTSAFSVRFRKSGIPEPVSE